MFGLIRIAVFGFVSYSMPLELMYSLASRATVNHIPYENIMLHLTSESMRFPIGATAASSI